MDPLSDEGVGLVKELGQLIFDHRCQLADLIDASTNFDQFLKVLSSKSFQGDASSVQLSVCISPCNDLKHCCEMERWTFNVLHVDDGPTVIPLFLKNAVKSQLHFSSLSSWVKSIKEMELSMKLSMKIEISMKSEAQLSNVQEHSFPIVKYQEGCILKVVHQFIPKEGYSNIFKCKCLPNIPVLFIVNKTNNNSNVRKRDPSTDERARKTLQRIRRHTVGDGLPEKKEKTVWSQGRRSLFNTRTRRSSQSGLLGSFEESALHGRLKPTASVSGFSIELISDSMKAVKIPIETFFFDVSDDNIPSLYMGQCDLSSLEPQLCSVKKKSRIQATVFNPQGKLVYLFAVDLDLSDMPSSSTTFVRQRVFSSDNKKDFLRHLIHLRLASDEQGSVHIHTDIRLLFTNKADPYASDVKSTSADFKVTTEMPQNPKYSSNLQK